jgi:RNA-binding protein
MIKRRRMLELRGKDKRFLRALGNNLPVHLKVSFSGLSDSLIKSLEDQLGKHELIKLKLHKSLSPQRKHLAKELASLSNASLIQLFGNCILLYKSKEPPTIKLPD